MSRTMRIYEKEELQSGLCLFKKDDIKYKMIFSILWYKRNRFLGAIKNCLFSDRDSDGYDCHSLGFPITTSIAFADKKPSKYNRPLYFIIETIYGYHDPALDIFGQANTDRFEMSYNYSYHLQQYNCKGEEAFSFRTITRKSYKHIPFHWMVYNDRKLCSIIEYHSRIFC